MAVTTNALIVLGYILHSTGPTHRQIADDCLEEIIRKHFHFSFGKSDENHTMLLTVLVTNNMASPAHEIQENIIVKIHEIAKWYQVEVIASGKQYGFESFDECSNTEQEEDEDEDEDEEAEAVQNDDCEKHFIIDFKTTFYVIIVDNENSFDNIMEVLENSNSFNPRALYLVYIESDYKNCRETAEKILLKMWDKVLIRTAVLIPESLQVLKLYKLDTSTKGPSVCGTNITLMEIDSCVKGRMDNIQKNYYGLNSNRNHFNCSLHVISKPYEPFVINETAGFEIEVLQNIGTILNINFVVSISKNMTDTWGTKENGSWTGNLKYIYEDFYLGVGNIETGMGYDTDFISSRQYHMEPLVHVVPIAQFVPKWRVLIAIFTLQMWGICVGIIILFAVTFYLTSKFGEDVADFKKFTKCFSTSLQIIINHSVTAQPTSDLTRVFFLSLAIFSIIISSAYTSSLVYYLKNPVREHQPTTNSELLSSSGSLEYDIGGVSRYRELFNVSDYQQAYQVFQAYQVANGSNDTALYWINRVAQDRNIWTISSKLFVNYLLSQDNNVTTDQNGRPKVFAFKQKLRSYSISIIMRKGHPVLKQIDYVIKKFVWGGLVEQIRSKYKNAILKKRGLTDIGQDDYKPLTTDHLQGAFALLLLGYILGFTSVIAEVATKKIIERKRSKKVTKK